MSHLKVSGRGPRSDVAVAINEYLEMATGILSACGATDVVASVQAEALLEGDLRGRASHGIQHLSTIVGRIRAGLQNPTTTGLHTWRTDSVLAVDGLAGLGPPVAMAVVDALVDRAPSTGIACASISNSGHLGMLAPYVERFAAEGLVSLASTTSEALVHPWGGTQALVGTNPIAIGVPTAATPVVIDMATGAISRGRVIAHAQRGEPLPPGTVIDAHGGPTVNPSAALNGAISPFGRDIAKSCGLRSGV